MSIVIRELPCFDPQKENLPRRSNFIGALSWLRAIQKCLGDSFVFALDEALMCDGSFLGRSEEFLVWCYGDDSASRFNGVVLLGSQVDPMDIQERNALRYTSFQRTLADALENERILDMQGITEALSKYYYTNGNSFNGLFIAPKYQERFKGLADDAIKYYED